MWFFVAACFVSAWLVAFAATALLRRFAPRWGLIDRPAARKVHAEPIPLGGGIGIWLGVVLPLLAAQGTVWLLTRSGSPTAWLPAEVAVHLEGVLYRSGQLWSVLAAGTILAVMGLLDDRRSLPWPPRLLVQVCVATALTVGGIRATLFVGVPWIGAILTVLWFLVLINAFNFLDNMDGLSAGVALIAALLFADVMLSSAVGPRWLVGGLLLVIAGSLAGFLCHNWPPARIFMGDSGSYFIGLLLAATTVLGTFYEPEVSGRHVILAPLCILAVPLYDFATVTVVRLLEGRSPFHPDKSHFSHRLVERGLSPRQAVLTVHLATLTTGLGALILYRISDWTGALLVVALVACVLAIVAILEFAGRSRDAGV